MNQSNNSTIEAHMVNSIKQEIAVMVMGKPLDLPCSDLADGCIGVSLWFDTLENAVAYGKDGDTISKAHYTPNHTINKTGESDE